MKKDRRTSKIDIRVSRVFIEALQRIQRDIPSLSQSDIISISLGKYIAADWRYHADEKMFNLGQQLQDITHIKNRSKKSKFIGNGSP